MQGTENVHIKHDTLPYNSELTECGRLDVIIEKLSVPIKVAGFSLFFI